VTRSFFPDQLHTHNMRFFPTAAMTSMVLLALPFSVGAANQPDGEATTHRNLVPLLSSTEKFEVKASGPRQITRGAVYALTITIVRNGFLSNTLLQAGLPNPKLTPEQQAAIDLAKLKFLAEQAAKNNGLDPKLAGDAVTIGAGTAKVIETIMEGGSRRGLNHKNENGKRRRRAMKASQEEEKKEEEKEEEEEEEEETELATKRALQSTKNIVPPPNGVKYGLRVSIPTADAAFVTLQNVKTSPFIPIAARFPVKSADAGNNILTWRALPMTSSTVKDTTIKITLRFKVNKTTPVGTVLNFNVAAFTYNDVTPELAVETAPVVTTTVGKSKWGRE